MGHSAILDLTLALLGGELTDASGAVLTPANRPITVVAADAAGATSAAAVLAAGRRALVPVPLAAPGAVGRLRAIGSARPACRRARRLLAAAGATRIRTFAVVPGRDALFLVYELGEPVQPYVEERVMLEPPRVAPHVRLLKGLLGAVSGVPTGVDLVVVVGERA
jgi:hypothetical protein